MLTNTEIQKLFDFTRKKYVRYIDVQVELVDHLASSIEELMASNPSINFDQALSKVYSRFPITGFSDLIKEKTKSLNFFWFKKLKTYMYSFLEWPKVLWFILIYMSYYVLTLTVHLNVVFKLTVAISVLFIIYEILKYWKFRSDNSHKFLSLTTYYGFCYWVFLFPTQAMCMTQTYEPIMLSGKIQVFVCAIASIYIITLYALFIVFPTQIKNDVLRQYKHLMPQSN